MDFTLNELSLKKLNSNESAIKTFMELSDVVGALSSIGFKAMKIWDKSTFLNYQFTDETTLIKWLKQKNYDSNIEKIKSQKLKSIISKKDSVWSDEERTIIVNCPIIGIQLQGSQEVSEGLKIACLYNTIAVSFKSDTFWDKSSLELIHITEDENRNTIEQTVTVKHASSKVHIDEQNKWLSSLLAKGLIGTEWKPSKNLFPNLDFSNQLVEDGDWSNFLAERDASENANERLAVIIDIGRKVASRNQYYPDHKVSQLNTTSSKKRIVFGAGKGKDRIYLSIDLEKGGFEVCNYVGEHIGEYFYDGSKQSDKKAGHNLKIKS